MWAIYTEKELLHFLLPRLSGQEAVYAAGEQREELHDRIYRILFQEECIPMETMEARIFPFEQSGFLTAEQKLELLLYLAEREEGEGGIERLLKCLKIQEQPIITEMEIENQYVLWRREDKGFLSWEEKKSFFVRRLANRLGAGVVGLLLKIGGDEILLGEYCPPCEKIKYENTESKLGIRRGTQILRFPFLKLSEEELERIIRVLIAKEKRGEITEQNPIWCNAAAGGRRLEAIRPPAAQHWGMKIKLEMREEVYQ